MKCRSHQARHSLSALCRAAVPGWRLIRFSNRIIAFQERFSGFGIAGHLSIAGSSSHIVGAGACLAAFSGSRR